MPSPAATGTIARDRSSAPTPRGDTIETELFFGAYGDIENSRAQADAAIEFRTRQGANGTDYSLGVDIFASRSAGGRD